MLANGGWGLIQRLTLILLTWTIWRAPTNTSKWRMGFNSAFKGLNDANCGFFGRTSIKYVFAIASNGRRSGTHVRPFSRHAMKM